MSDLMDPGSAAAKFAFGELINSVQPLRRGHINTTYLVRGCGGESFALQRINRDIFPDVAALMRNFVLVTDHLRAKGIATLELIPTRGGATYFHSEENGECWRALRWIGNSSCLEKVDSIAQAEVAARAFGEFAAGLADLPPQQLHETLPDFHNTRKRFADLQDAIRKDGHNRAAESRQEIAAALAAEDWAGEIMVEFDRLPQRVAHNDAKIENLLFDSEGDRALCVIDLDTVMPGTPLHDFGDLVRSAAPGANEEELDLAKVEVCRDRLAALERGFVGGMGDQLGAAERACLAHAGSLITWEQALRFLQDHLRGDPYYRIQRPGQNLDRARNQLHVLKQLREI